MGLLDLPAPAFDWLDGRLAFLTDYARLLLWGAASGALSIALYGWLSPQRRIAEGKQDALRARQRLNSFDGELDAAWPLLAGLMGTSLRQVGRVAVPALAASIPALCVMAWLSNQYGHTFPDATPAAVTVTPDSYQGSLTRAADGAYRIEIADRNRRTIARLPLPEPIPVVEKRHWWNALIGNPAGYLDPSAPVERVAIALPRTRYLETAPGWMSGWEFGFFAALIAMSLIVKRAFRIH